MNIIYVVTSGIYSDYSIDGVFESKEAAESFIASRTFTNRYNIEEFVLGKKADSYPYWVEYYPSSDKWNVYNADEPWQDNEVNVVNKRFGNYYTYVQAKTRDAALKTANEKIMMAIAKGK